ncbi:YbaK/EbsC family protein [Hyphomicrobium sp. LHD-15]|uniref:aminoacyl-tRNA deacylase n=1 Tax=Hyphomicrobium sp. LHD-15 TaxID=3072142 RepID=UPI00280D4F7B|nr:YbaK/EbsC family protein [Hyphomicrobium sp. LHD-15]MDQ8699408.1 YbaK/EbsC family protein [Hyphomicrobium sp. LHD-15]
MGIASTVQHFLDGRGVAYDVLTHDRTLRSSTTAEACGISEDNLAKGVLVRHRDGYLLAILPASRHLELEDLGVWLKHPVGLATETEIAKIFGDCELGAVPPVAGAYGLPGVMDDSLEGFEDIYFEGGDHRTLVHLNGREFRRLMVQVPHSHISRPNH